MILRCMGRVIDLRRFDHSNHEIIDKTATEVKKKKRKKEVCVRRYVDGVIRAKFCRAPGAR